MKLAAVAYVTVIDLRREELTLDSDFSELQRSRLPTVPQGLVDATRVIVIDSSDELASHSGAIGNIVLAASVEHVLCIVVGKEEQVDASGCVLRFPPIFASDSVEILWVGDPRGILWSMGTSKAQAIAKSESDPDGLHALEALVDSLRVPEVFDAVFEGCTAMSGPASPAPRLLVPGSGSPDLVAAAQNSSTRTLTGEINTDVSPGFDNSPDIQTTAGRLFGNAPAPLELFDGDKPIGRRAAHVKAVAETASKAAEEILDRPNLRASAEEPTKRIRELGEALAELKRYLVAELYEKMDGSNGLDPDEIGVLRDSGLRTAAIQPQKTDAGESDSQIRDFAMAELRRLRSLLPVVGALRSIAAKASPRSTARTLEVLNRACPDDLVEGLRTFSPLQIRLSGTRSLLSLVLLCGAITWIPGPFIPIPVIAVGVLALALLLLSGSTTLKELRSYISLQRSEVAILCGAAIAGFAGGGVIRAVADSTPLTIIGIVVVPLLYIAWALEVWRESTARWLNKARIEEARLAVDEMLQSTAEIAYNDWILANPRLRFSRTATRLADCLDQIRTGLEGEIAAAPKDDSESAQNGGRCNPAIRVDLSDGAAGGLLHHTGDVTEIVLEDYIDLIGNAIETSWVKLSASPDSQGWQAAYGLLRDRMTAYSRDLHGNGLFKAPALGLDGQDIGVGPESSKRRLALLADLWSEISGINDLLRLQSDAELVQLCLPRQLDLLDEAPDRASMVRFAPRTHDDGNKGLRVTRTSSMLLAGVIRLVPLRTGTFEVQAAAGLSPRRKAR